MTAKVHAAAGALAGALAGRVLGAPLAGLALGALAGLLPDLDHPESALGRRLWPLSAALNAFLGHRGFTHTVWFALLLAFLPGALLPLAGAGWRWAVLASLAALAGALSHVLLDACTRSGVQPFSPLALPGRLARLNHVSGPLATGTEVVEAPLAVLLLLLGLKAAGVF